MKTQPISFTPNQIAKNFITKTYKQCELPTKARPYAIFDDERIDTFVKSREAGVPLIAKLADNAKTEAEKTECIFIADQMAEAGVKGMDKLYYNFSRFNGDKSPNVQTFLSGFYRKTLNPDGFGPLVKTMMDNINSPHRNLSYDPNEEVGGAVIEYIRDAFQKSLIYKQK